MSTKLFSSYEKTDRDRIPDGNIDIDATNPVGASIAAAIITAVRTKDYDGIGNALVLNDKIRCKSKDEETVVGYEEEYSLQDKKGNVVTVWDPAKVKSMVDSGSHQVVGSKRTEIKG